MTKLISKKHKKNIVCGVTAVAVAVSAYGFGGLFDKNNLASGDVTEIYKYDSTEEAEVTDVTEEPNEETASESDIMADLASELSVEEKEVDKDETVYGFAKADGSIDHVIVSETLKNREKADVLTDMTNLKDIENVKGNEAFSQNGNEITWEANGNDITYQGTTDEKLPIDISVSTIWMATGYHRISWPAKAVRLRFVLITKIMRR